MAKDLVCGMDVEEKTAKYKTTYKGKEYFFCAPGCQRMFKENPEEYVGDSAGPSNKGCCCGHC